MKKDRRINRGTLALSCALLMNPATSAVAQTSDATLAEFARSLPQDVLRQIAQRPDNFLQQMSQQLFSLSPEGVATPAAAELHASRQQATARANFVTRLLRYDLDGDGTVTASEIELQLPYLQSQERGQLTLLMVEVDENDDQDLSFAEIRSAAQSEVDGQNSRRSGFDIDSIMAFDANGNGRVDLAEVASVIAAIDAVDLENVVRRPSAQREPAVICEVPKPVEQAELVFLSANEGQLLSTLAVAGQDEVTSVATITIAEGTAPLYIFATANSPIIWKIEGATERVQQVVAQPNSVETGPGVAVAGISSESVLFVEPKSCVTRFIPEMSAETNARMAPLLESLGRSFDHLFLARNMGGSQVIPATNEAGNDAAEIRPYRTTMTFLLGESSYDLSAAGMAITGSEPPAQVGEASALSPVRSMMRFYPNGMIALSPEDVHASARVEFYEILPNQAGLLQLLADGTVEYRSDDSYYIKEPIGRFPAQLFGGHSVKFVLAPGVPMPAGSPGHSSVISEETGECLVRHPCRQ